MVQGSNLRDSVAGKLSHVKLFLSETKHPLTDSCTANREKTKSPQCTYICYSTTHI